VGLLFTDAAGRATGDAERRMALPRAESGTLMLIATSSLAPGAYTLKLAVAREGRVGSVEHPLEARVTQPDSAGAGAAGPLQLGELLVMTPASSRSVTPGLDVRVQGDRIVSLAPLGLAPPLDRFSFVFEIARGESAGALVSMVGAVDEKPKGRARFAEATLDARLLPPGAYGLRLEVRSDGDRVASLYTPFRLERTAAADGSGRTGTSAPLPSAAFLRSDALDPMVLGPFLEEVARLSPASSRPAFDLARSGRVDEAVRSLEPGEPGDPALPFLRGLALFEKGDLQPASNEFRAAIAEAPELLVGAFFLGACYAAGGKDTQAIGAWQTSLTALGRYPAVYRFLGDALMRTGQADRARRLLAEAAARWPGDEAFRPRVVAAALGAGEYQQALDAADQLVADQPDDSSLLFLAMRSAFQALLDGAEVDRPLLVERLERYRELYASAGGLQQPLVDEWVSFARARR
jgi:tetratricopeptide (TPR) repeat protein